MNDLIVKSGCQDRALRKAVEKVSSECVTCCKFSKTAPRPVVSLPMASKFNETVSMDLKMYEGKYFLVMVDLATRYCAASLIDNKKPMTVIRAIFLRWISIFGCARKFLTDNGGEFNNQEFQDMGEKFNIRVMCTSAESPFSNGVCERLNAVLGNTVSKIVNDSGCDISTALAWAVSARNSLLNNFGFSPNQLVFGFNPGYPTIENSEPPALEQPKVRIVEDNLRAMRVAREEFMKRDSDDGLRRALKHNVRENKLAEVNIGDQVYYKRNDSDEWKGPGSVIGREGSQVLVRHGGLVVRVHAVHLRISPNNIPIEVMDREDSCRNETAQEEGTVRKNNLMNSINVEEEEDNKNIDHEEIHEEINGELESCRGFQGNPPLPDESRHSEPSETGGSVLKSFKIGDRVQGIHKNTGELVSGTIISRAGKASGKYKNSYNIEKNDGSIENYDMKKDFEHVDKISSEQEMLVLYNNEAVNQAKDKELKNWLHNEVFEEVESSEGQKVISVRWVITEKLQDGEKIVKARLVARGFEEDTEGLRKDSPTCSREAVRLAVSLASTKSWKCHTLDVRAAYLQGNRIEREVFVKPPPEFDNGMVWKLKKTVYGLSDAARAWYLRVKSELQRLGVRMSKFDSALFSWYSGNDCHGVICVYVDDFLWAGTDLFYEQVIKKLEKLFLIGKFGQGEFKYIGLKIDNNDSITTIDQLEYASSIQPISVSCKRAGDKSSEINEKEKTEFRSLLGQLNWVGTQTRPDILFDVGDLTGSAKTATINELLRLNKVVSRLDGHQVKLKFPPMEDINGCHLQVFSDASFGNLGDGGSQVGLIVFLVNSDGIRCPLYWQSKKARRVVKSTLAAETLALIEGAEAAVFISRVISDLLSCTNLKIQLSC